MATFRVLIADDEPDTRELLQAVCLSRGFETTLAADGAAAVAVLRQSGPFDIVISDIHMPGADGFDVLDAAIAASPQCRVVLVTGYGTPDDRDRALARGAAAFLLKSTSLHSLGEVLDGLAPVQPRGGPGGAQPARRLEGRAPLPGGFARETRHVYRAGAPQRVVLRLKGVDAAVVIEADTIEPTDEHLELRRAGNIVARFSAPEVLGWWLETA